jgi:hypothetical protein
VQERDTTLTEASRFPDALGNPIVLDDPIPEPTLLEAIFDPDITIRCVISYSSEMHTMVGGVLPAIERSEVAFTALTGPEPDGSDAEQRPPTLGVGAPDLIG